MITHLKVSNFRSLGPDVNIRLGRLTALVGPNGSGKSNVTDALRFVSDALSHGLDAALSARQGIGAVRRWSRGRPFDVRIETCVMAGPYFAIHEFALGSRLADYNVKGETATVVIGDADNPDVVKFYQLKDGQWLTRPEELRPALDPRSLALPLVAGDEHFRPLYEALRDIEIYSIFPDTLREPQKADPSRPMQRHGKNWCSILKGGREESWAPELRTALGRLTGDIDDVRVKQVGTYLFTEFHHAQADGNGAQRDKWFDAAQESDGTLRVAGILTALLQEPPLTLIGIEEPELTVHPGALPLLYDYLKQASAHSQVLVTTHSPELLDLFDADDVRVVERADGVTTVSPLDKTQRDAVRQRLLTLGDLVRMEGLKPDREASAGLEGSRER